MSYRKLTINDKVYEYTIGKTNTKVKLDGKAFKIYENSAIGSPLGYPCGINPHRIYAYVVSPKNAKNAIMELGLPEFKTREGMTTWLMADPFEDAIYRRIVHIPYSLSLHENLAGDI